MIPNIPGLFMQHEGKKILTTYQAATRPKEFVVDYVMPQHTTALDTWLDTLNLASQGLMTMLPRDAPAHYQLDLALLVMRIWRAGMDQQSPFKLVGEVDCLEYADMEAREVFEAVRRHSTRDVRNNVRHFEIANEVADTMAMLLSGYVHDPHFSFYAYVSEFSATERDIIDEMNERIDREHLVLRVPLHRMLGFATTGALRRATSPIAKAAWYAKGLEALLISVEMLGQDTWPAYCRCLQRWETKWHPNKGLNDFEVA